MYYLVRELTGKRGPGYISATLYVLSPSLIRMGLDFINNIIGLTFTFAILLLLVKNLKDNRYIYPAIAFIIIVSLTHILDFGYLIISLLIFIVAYYLWERRILRSLLYAASSAAIMVLLGLLIPIIMGDDLYKVAGLFRRLLEDWWVPPLHGFEIGLYLSTLIIVVATVYIVLRKSSSVDRYMVLALSISSPVLLLPI